MLNTDVYFERIDDIDIITNPTSYLNCDHMSLFQSIVKVYTDFKPQETYLIQIPQNIKPINQGCKNIQILFQADKISTGVEHWISSYYDGCTVHIYDSLNRFSLRKLDEKYIKILYGEGVPIKFHKVQQQNNVYDCGIFAIAFMTSICFGKKPENEKYNLIKMRQHTYKMLKDRELYEFPTL